MASTYTTNLGIEKPGTGDQVGSWGDTTNTNFDIFDRAIRGVVTVNISGLATATVQTSQGALSDGQAALIIFSGSGVGIQPACDVTLTPGTQERVSYVYNNSGNTITFKASTLGATVQVAHGDANILYTTGLGTDPDVYDLSLQLKAKSDIIFDTTPQLGGSLDVNNFSITSANNNDVYISPDGTGSVIVNKDVEIGQTRIDSGLITTISGDLDIQANTNNNVTVTPQGTGHFAVSGYAFPTADGAAGQALVTDGAGQLSFSNSVLPLGSILPYAGTTAPAGFVLCFGQQLNTYDYRALHAVISDTYGGTAYSAGVTDQSGVTTQFNVPDLRGRVVAGQDDMGGVSADRLTGVSGGVNGDNLGAAGGSQTHSLTSAQLASHFHYTIANVDGGYTSHALATNDYVSKARQYPYGGGGEIFSYTLHGQTGTAATMGKSSTVGSGSGHNNVQPTLILNYIIKV